MNENDHLGSLSHSLHLHHLKKRHRKGKIKYFPQDLKYSACKRRSIMHSLHIEIDGKGYSSDINLDETLAFDIFLVHTFFQAIFTPHSKL
jgi:hypothetical protein